jgi:hypothetical protein
MRAIPLLCVFLLTASLLCAASDEKVTPDSGWLMAPSGRTGSAFVPLESGQRASTTLRRHRANPQRRSDNDSCLMLRTYIVVREDRDSDVTVRDGEVICQPTWKFQTKSAVGKVDEH